MRDSVGVISLGDAPTSLHSLTLGLIALRALPALDPNLPALLAGYNVYVPGHSISPFRMRSQTQCANPSGWQNNLYPVRA
jgi:hypothetical protein